MHRSQPVAVSGSDYVYAQLFMHRFADRIELTCEMIESDPFSSRCESFHIGTEIIDIEEGDDAVIAAASDAACDLGYYAKQALEELDALGREPCRFSEAVEQELLKQACVVAAE